ncbi:hypothetical protein GCM10023195_71180 [Actinoallomurus liliacearum]|uniref:Uncharacterized protein n=2 Tax=Actinoallomurus liliacearum TaxID=1080073 RepID=A0ABP8TTF1_9ACTN
MTGGIAIMASPVNQVSIAEPSWHLRFQGAHPECEGGGVTTGVGVEPFPAQRGTGSPGVL